MQEIQEIFPCTSMYVHWQIHECQPAVKEILEHLIAHSVLTVSVIICRKHWILQRAYPSLFRVVLCSLNNFTHLFYMTEFF